jgi:hypothetical protein
MPSQDYGSHGGQQSQYGQAQPQYGAQAPAEQGKTVGGLLSPREDENAPDLYIPAMAFVTYVLVAGSYRGLVCSP